MDIYLSPETRTTPLPREYQRLIVIRWGVVAAVVLLGTVVLGIFTAIADVPLWLTLVCGALLIGVLISIVVDLRRARIFGYAELEDVLLIRSGIMFQRVTTIPYGRMQQVHLGTGPILSRLGLATVELVTASIATNAKIPGVKREEAERLRTRLTEIGTATMEGL